MENTNTSANTQNKSQMLTRIDECTLALTAAILDANNAGLHVDVGVHYVKQDGKVTSCQFEVAYLN